MSITRPRPDVAVLAHRRRRQSMREGGPGHRLRLAFSVRWQAADLDRRLAAGESPGTNDALALRARLITSPRRRRQLAAGLAGVLRSAQRTAPAWSAAIRPLSTDVLQARAVIAAIDRRLRAPEPVAARGVAMVRALLIDGNGLLYRPGGPGALGSRLRAAAAALEPRR